MKISEITQKGVQDYIRRNKKQIIHNIIKNKYKDNPNFQEILELYK